MLSINNCDGITTIHKKKPTDPYIPQMRSPAKQHPRNPPDQQTPNEHKQNQKRYRAKLVTLVVERTHCFYQQDAFPELFCPSAISSFRWPRPILPKQVIWTKDFRYYDHMTLLKPFWHSCIGQSLHTKDHCMAIKNSCRLVSCLE